jgi:hypothetical protein
MTPRGSYKDQRIGGIHRFHHQSEKNRLAKNYVSYNWQQMNIQLLFKSTSTRGTMLAVN